MKKFKYNLARCIMCLLYEYVWGHVTQPTTVFCLVVCAVRKLYLLWNWFLSIESRTEIVQSVIRNDD